MSTSSAVSIIDAESIPQSVEDAVTPTIDTEPTPQAVDDMISSLSKDTTDVLHTMKARTETLTVELEDSILQSWNKIEGTLETWLDGHESIKNILTSVLERLDPLLSSYGVELTPALLMLAGGGVVTSFVVFGVVLINILSGNGDDGETMTLDRPYPTNKYDPDTAKKYFEGNWIRLLNVWGRGLNVTRLSLAFGLGLLSDYIFNKLESNADQRAEELTILLTKLGPSFIKIGQSLSIRTDILSPPYVRGLKKLQDQVPPFPTSVARKMMEEELGVSDLGTVFEDLTMDGEPVAAASLGQVYKAKLARPADGSRSKMEVAIKVQRPDIMNQIALDMYLIRNVAPVLKRTFNLNTDLVGVVDQWGYGFVDELDYISEADNARRFMESIVDTPLNTVVFAPPVIEECTTTKVLTTEWVDGERLDKSGKDDVTVLCSIAMNTYLTMMLETGLLHCDPHPGNLLRTTEDGRLCILDWGMVTRLDSDLQITLIEHMAHLTSADYDEIPLDLLKLGFIPEAKKDLIKDSGVVETLADIYTAWTKGGGAAKINVNKVVTQLQDLTATRGNLFQIPPYFAYIAKSFSVLEGIGLSNDEDYSIINECLPYVSKRLLTDNTQRTGRALSTFIFGPDKDNIDTRIIDYDRVEDLILGFEDYTTSASGAQLTSQSATSSSTDTANTKSRTQLIDELSEQIFDLILDDDDNNNTNTQQPTPLQTIFVEQLAKIISSTSRSLWYQLRQSSGTLPSGRTILGSLVDPLGIFRKSNIVRVSHLDQRTLETTRNLIRLIQDRNVQGNMSTTTNNNAALDVSTLEGREVVELSWIIGRKVWERRRGVVKTGNRLARKLLELTSYQLERGNYDDDEEEYDDEVKKEDVPTATTTTLSPSSADGSRRLSAARKMLSDLQQQE